MFNKHYKGFKKYYEFKRKVKHHIRYYSEIYQTLGMIVFALIICAVW